MCINWFSAGTIFCCHKRTGSRYTMISHSEYAKAYCYVNYILWNKLFVDSLQINKKILKKFNGYDVNK